MKTPQVLKTMCVLAALMLAACNGTANAELQTQGDAYIRQHIGTLSPSPTTAGQFTVTSVTWIDADTALVTYENGQVSLKGSTDVSMKDGVVTATTIRLDIDTGASSSKISSVQSSVNSVLSIPSSSISSTPVSSRPRVGLGAFCGGIAAFQCAEGLHCAYDGNYPDEGGTCVR